LTAFVVAAYRPEALALGWVWKVNSHVLEVLFSGWFVDRGNGLLVE
jgi:hypothetical protein